MIEPIPLARAVFCADCNCITETNGKMYCEYCKSGAIIWLQQLLDGPNPLPLPICEPALEVHTP